MYYKQYGNTDMKVSAIGLGTMRYDEEDIAAGRLEKCAEIPLYAFEKGINYWDTAPFYCDDKSEIVTGIALSQVKRSDVYVTSKTNFNTIGQNPTRDDFRRRLEMSLQRLQTDYIDLYQFHNPAFCPKPGDGTGLYEAALEAKEQGKIRHIGITNHRIAVAKEAVLSGLYETLQFPFSYLASEEEKELVKLCKETNTGFIAMKGLAGGLIHNSALAYAFMCQPEYSHVEPIWGVQREWELDEFLSYQDKSPKLTEELKTEMQKDKDQLAGEFCRGCGYCMPCPAGIEINNCARMSLMLRRAPQEAWLSEEWQEKIEDCLHCGNCMKKCPYGLNTPELLKRNYEDYQTFL